MGWFDAWRGKQIAAAVTENSDDYTPGSAAYSPEYTPSVVELGHPNIQTHRQSPQDSTSDAPAPYVPAPPSPSVGGQPGLSTGYGYSTGLLPSRTMRGRFTGKTLVVPTMGVHPNTGPVGLSNRSGRLATGVAALVDTWLPSQSDVNQQIVGTPPRNRNPLDT